jgi:hypothetical protein
MSINKIALELHSSDWEMPVSAWNSREKAQKAQAGTNIVFVLLAPFCD